jgi:hypothetical protein
MYFSITDDFPRSDPMKPTTKREEEIVERVDHKARAIRDGVGAWDNRVVPGMRGAVGFQMSVAEEHGGA